MDKKLTIISVAAFIFLAISILIISLAIVYSQKDVRIAEMVKNGANPIAASCAVGVLSRQTCESYLTKEAIKDSN